MATDSEIRVVTESLGPDAGAGGWTDDRISSDLDDGMTANEIALAWWTYRTANTVNLVSVSESGSSRTLSDIHSNALAMMTLYRKLVDADNLVEVTPVVPVRGIRAHAIRRGIVT